MQNSMGMFILYIVDWKHPFWTNLFQKIKMVSAKIWYLDKFKYAEFDGGVHFFCFIPEIPFLVNEDKRSTVTASATVRK